jgi:hypothetical protein
MSNKLVYIACIPLSYEPTPPKEQTGLEIHQCPMCNADMWVSEKKRALKEKQIGSKMLCGQCCFIDMIAKGIDPKDAKIVDILNMNAL